MSVSGIYSEFVTLSSPLLRKAKKRGTRQAMNQETDHGASRTGGPLGDLRIEDLLPHRNGMLLVDEVLEVDSTRAVTRSRARDSWPLSGPVGVDPLILVELAAQAAGVCNGWDRIRTQGLDSNQMGWLVAVKKAEFHVETIPLGATVIARAENTYNFENLREVECELRVNGRPAGCATLQLFQARES